jgi:hypothetical protein
MREMKQLRNNSKKPPISHRACHLTAVKAAHTVAIQDLNFVHKSFSGNQTRLGVTYPTVWNLLAGAFGSAPPSAVTDFLAEAHMTLGSTIFMADLLPEGCSKIQTDGGSSGYDKVE